MRSLRALGTASTLAVALTGCIGPEDASDDARAGVTRRYFVAAEEVDWDYAPDGYDVTMGRDFGEDASVFVAGNGVDRVGSVYRKAIFRQYSDDTFTTPVDRPEWAHAGLLGPVLRAAVGDTIEIVFENHTTMPTSMHPHGVRYDKASEGAGSNDGTTDAERGDDAVAPGERYVYRWEVPETAGPGPAEPSSKVWLYHSHADTVGDTNAGLIGAIVVTRANLADDTGAPVDVDREMVSLFAVLDENASRYADENRARFAPEADPEDEEFEESNLMHSINGRVFGNGDHPTMTEGDLVRWYLLDLGTEVDLHTPHWHGNTVMVTGERTDIVELLPASMKVADMQADNPGTWLYHCHVDDHIIAGMSTLYEVQRR